METLFSQIADACKPVVQGIKQNHYKFKRKKVSGVFLIDEYDSKWATTVEGAEAQLSGEGWVLMTATKYDIV